MYIIKFYLFTVDNAIAQNFKSIKSAFEKNHGIAKSDNGNIGIVVI